MYDIENAKLIEKINAVLGTKHRNKPYDMTDASDMKHALQYAAAAYRDYWYYTITLSQLAENFDESLEHYDTASWYYMGRSPEKTDMLSAECAEAINVASTSFEEITERAKYNFMMILKIVLTSPPDMQNAVLGRTYEIEPRAIDKMINELIDMLGEVDYAASIPENFTALLNLMREMWG
jgi:hypothetical protein